ncbi:uncharacterized protein LOC120351403 [Nilaparvata lugens]|uniref:uncharacterized protein LOC120351403 n=1 Tax=Nilaparvata lugens TaxID=108931 RepID=UPI00193CF502|nr:uncharacterized protein LOC120351403 [Nilaparvata lugens]
MGVKKVTVIRPQPIGKIFVKPNSALFPRTVALKETDLSTDTILRPEIKIRAVESKDPVPNASKINLGILTNPRSEIVLGAVKPGVAPKSNLGAETNSRGESNAGAETHPRAETNAGANTDSESKTISKDVVVSIKKGVKEVTVIRSQPTGKIFVKPDSALFPKAVSLKQTNPGTDAILRPQTKLRAVMPKDASKINLGTLTNPRGGMVLGAVKPGVAPKINSGAETHPRAETNTGVEVNFGCETNAGAETDLAAEASTALAGINSVSENNGGADIATPTHLEAQYLCTNCGKSYESKGSFKRHIKMVCDNKTTYLLCEHCPFKTKWPDSMKMHALMKHDSQIKGKLKNILQKKK